MNDLYKSGPRYSKRDGVLVVVKKHYKYRFTYWIYGGSGLIVFEELRSLVVKEVRDSL